MAPGNSTAVGLSAHLIVELNVEVALAESRESVIGRIFAELKTKTARSC